MVLAVRPCHLHSPQWSPVYNVLRQSPPLIHLLPLLINPILGPFDVSLGFGRGDVRNTRKKLVIDRARYGA